MTTDDSSDSLDKLSRLAPHSISRQAFARRLYNLMLKRGWNQSELGRQAGLPRDRISTYVRGKILPTPQNVEALARAFNIAPQDLLPDHVESAIDADNPAFEMKVSPNDQSKAWLRVNRLVTVKTALKVAEALEADDATSDRS